MVHLAPAVFDAVATVIRRSLVQQQGDDNPHRVARNILFALRDGDFAVVPSLPLDWEPS